MIKKHILGSGRWQTKLYAVLLLLSSPLLLNCGGTVGPVTKQDPTRFKPYFHRTEYDIPVTLNEYTAAWIDYYQTRGRDNFTRHLERSARYIPEMRKILASYGLPKDLVYIALIESGFSSKAYSSASASGFWQFIAPTGRRYQLQQDRYVDERRDFDKSTHAAARYLKDLYTMFGDWYLSAAAYNCGEGRISRVVGQAGTKDFWRMREGGFLPRETQDYVPKYLAAMIIAKHPENFGFNNLKGLEPLDYEEVDIKGAPMDLRVTAEMADTDIDTLNTLNPELKMNFTPLDRSNYRLRVPRKDADRFRAKLASMPEYMRMAQREHQVEAGESLDDIARRHNMTREYLALANGLSQRSDLNPGQKIGIPYSPPREYWASNESESDEAPSRGNKHYHKVRKGESLYTIAKRYKVSVNDLRSLNRGKIGKELKSGQNIIVRAGKSKPERVAKRGAEERTEGKVAKTYKVKSGDTVAGIAQRHGVSTAQLKAWNTKTLARGLQAGQQLKLYAQGQGNDEPEAPTVAKANTPTEEAPLKSSKGSYRIKAGDTLISIARKHQVTVAQLRAWNPGKTRELKAGQSLIIVGAGDEKPKTVAREDKPIKLASNTTSGAQKRAVIHKINSGDTLWDIAKKYGVSTSDIKRWNDLDATKALRPGTRLKIFPKGDGLQDV